MPTILEVDPEKHRLEDILRVNFGPNHPSTHGVLRLVVDLDGETVAGIRAVIGYLHTGFEKNMEHKSWWKSVTYAPRIDYVSFHANELLYVLAIEKLLGIEVPRRAVWARMAMAELNRIHSHLVWLGTSALELGAISLFWYCFDDRDQILDLFEMAGGARMHTRYVQVGGMAEDLPPAFTAEARKFCESMPKSVDEYEAILDRNAIWLERTKSASGCCRPTMRSRSRSRARCCARPGSTGICGATCRTSPTTRSSSTSRSTAAETSTTATSVHMDEMRESVRIVGQCLDRLDETEGEPWIADDRKVVLPPRHELHTSMESLIHHFKIVTEGFTVPEGEVYVAIESPRGEAGCYLVSDGGARPWRVKFRAPSFAALQATATIVQGLLIADLIAAGGSLDPVMGDADR